MYRDFTGMGVSTEQDETFEIPTYNFFIFVVLKLINFYNTNKIEVE